MKTRDLEVFAAVAARGSIQAAADAVGLTQPAVSRALQRLEDALGVALFDRSARPLRLTRQGEEAQARARAVLDAMAAMRGAFAADAPPRGPFRLGVSHAVAPIALHDGRLLGLADFPGLEPHIATGWSGPLIDALRRGDLDAAAVLTPTGADAPAGLARIPIAASPVGIAAPASEAGPIALADANARGWALNLDGCGFRRALEDALGAAGLPLNIVLQTNGLDLQFAHVAAGRAYALAPAVAIARTPALAMRASPDFSHAVELALLTASAAPPAPEVIRAVDAGLRAAFGP